MAGTQHVLSILNQICFNKFGLRRLGKQSPKSCTSLSTPAVCNQFILALPISFYCPTMVARNHARTDISRMNLNGKEYLHTANLKWKWQLWKLWHLEKSWSMLLSEWMSVHIPIIIYLCILIYAKEQVFPVTKTFIWVPAMLPVGCESSWD